MLAVQKSSKIHTLSERFSVTNLQVCAPNPGTMDVILGFFLFHLFSTSSHDIKAVSRPCQGRVKAVSRPTSPEILALLTHLSKDHEQIARAANWWHLALQCMAHHGTSLHMVPKLRLRSSLCGTFAVHVVDVWLPRPTRDIFQTHMS